MSQRVLRGSTATLTTYPPVLAQATGTPTARIRTPAVAMPDAGSNATVDTVSTDVTGDALAGRREVNITSAVLVRDRRYVAESTTGDLFPVLCAKGGTLDLLYLQEPLNTELLTGSTIKGYRLHIALTAEQTAQLGDCVIEWTATLNGIVEEWTDTFTVVERMAAETPYTLDAITLTTDSPYCKRMQGDGDNDFSETIRAAWRRFVEPALLAKGIKPHLFVGRKELEAAHIAACEHFAAQGPGETDQTVREEKRREWSAALDLVLNSETLFIDTEAQTLAQPDPDAPREWATTMVFR